MTAPQRQLLGLGLLAWDDVRSLVVGMTCAWADYDGFHLQPHDQLPSDAPAYSHLWAWSGDHAVRARFDGTQAYVGILTTDPSRWPQAVLTEQVSVTARDAWPHRDGAEHVSLHEVRGPMPITFVTMD